MHFKVNDHQLGKIYTMDVFDYVNAKSVAGNGCQHLACTPSPGQVVGWTPRSDGTEEQLKVVFLSQLLSWRNEVAELHKDLQHTRWRSRNIIFCMYKIVG